MSPESNSYHYSLIQFIDVMRQTVRTDGMPAGGLGLPDVGVYCTFEVMTQQKGPRWVGFLMGCAIGGMTGVYLSQNHQVPNIRQAYDEFMDKINASAGRHSNK
ncbi:hypothetical protein SARC_01901 [Sphaeroforma arctica JP610]|uniref:Uncharacterized protein n=1 Tax=Sphaeroforma arctica JP610 TaxID=667725 RepID=A0A0L0GAD5_9EUKA|nr:hypothetical protein SARC_01901 [Sphaeroforma arctica JP610]KNC85955.1 hypothetical protein SARC_01901 [Sphaeroforma arctica JP610]|eukprot:XP_014159857.1 hypothetical protein SARC_01901 [Sphaeroforma arctica JP610]